MRYNTVLQGLIVKGLCEVCLMKPQILFIKKANTLFVDAGGVKAKVVETIFARNGIIHIIDQV